MFLDMHAFLPLLSKHNTISGKLWIQGAFSRQMSPFFLTVKYSQEEHLDRRTMCFYELKLALGLEQASSDRYFGQT